MDPRPLLVSLVVLLAGCTATRGNPAPAPPAGVAPPATAASPASEAELLQRVRALNTPSSTNLITVYYTEGHQEKALRLRSLVEEAMRFYADSLGLQAPLSLAVLDRDHWGRIGVPQPYGIPGVGGTPPVAFLPATDDNVAADDALSIRAGVSPAALRLLEASGHSYEDGARRYVDLVGLHELGHAYNRAYGIRPGHRWLNELLATYAAYAFMRQRHPWQAQLWDGILQGYVDAVRPRHTSLEDFNRLYAGVGPQNYVWYQAQFQEMVRSTYEAKGLGFLREVRAAFPEGEAPASMDAALDRLERIQPGFRAWAAELSAMAPNADAAP